MATIAVTTENRMKIKDSDVVLLQQWALRLGYVFSINNQQKTVKLFNPLTKRYGYLQKYNNVIWYGYFKKDGDNNVFVKKIAININIEIFKSIKESTIDYNTHGDVDNLCKMFCGIIELDWLDK